jgi:excinuclease ABC subunit B
MPDFVLQTDFQPTGDQPQAIAKLIDGLDKGYKHQTLLGATGTGKTFCMANVIQAEQRPTLIIAHNKTLAAQLYAEFKDFFPRSAVEYFVSYYDYYQPEAYLPSTDTYIEKDADINDEIDRLRLAATSALLSRRDVIIVASVSCIFGLGSPEDYGRVVISLHKGEVRKRDKVLRHLVDTHYERNDYELSRGKFRVRGDTLEVQPAYEEFAYRVEFWGDEIERIVEVDTLTGEILAERDAVDIYPAKHFITPEEKLVVALEDIREAPANSLRHSAWSIAPSMIWRCSNRLATVRGSRTTPAIWRSARREAPPGPCSTTSPTTSC